MMTMSTGSGVSYRVTGSGPLLIYIAGLDGTGELFFKQAPELSESYRVVTFRQRERGEFTYEDLAADVAAIIDDLGEQRATIVGESFGGTIALTFALLHPSRVERLIVLNSFPRYRGRLRIHALRILNSVLPFRSTRPLRVAANLLGLYLDGVSAADRRRFFEAARTVKGRAYLRRLKLIAGFNVLGRLHEIATPALFIAAERDIVVPSQKEARVMSERVPGARMLLLRGVGHGCLLGSRVRLAAILDGWKSQA
jgi:pimeloyl-ACP methyl ester carboxylesterase